MKIDGKNYKTLSVYPSMMTVPDCMVVRQNKIGTGHGEAKFYVGSKEKMYEFYGAPKFQAKCFMLKADLIAYMLAIKNEYLTPSYEYADKENLPSLWQERFDKISQLEDMIFFTIKDQDQLEGTRGYINTKDSNYKIIREIALPLVSYIYCEKLGDENSPLFYWKLFVDFDAIWEKQNGPLVFSYGKQKDAPTEAKPKKKDTKSEEIKKARDGQGKYREQLLLQCRFCPFTMIADERLLIASHIKPWAASNDKEKVDPYNGYMLSPLFDKLFDRGYITFTEKRHIILSEVISPYTWKQIGLKNDDFIKALPMDDKRIEYLIFHRQSIFKGRFEE